MIVTLYAVALAAISGIAVWYASGRWWHVLIIAILSLPLFPLVAHWLTGDISPYLPEDAFPHGKDALIWASVYATVVIAVIAAAMLWWIITQVWRLIMRTDQRSPSR